MTVHTFLRWKSSTPFPSGSVGIVAEFPCAPGTLPILRCFRLAAVLQGDYLVCSPSWGNPSALFLLGCKG